MNYSEEVEKELQKLLKELEDAIENDLDDSDFEEFSGLDLNELEKNFEIPRYSHTLTYEKVDDNAVVPKYNYPSDSGFDLHSVEDVTIPSLDRKVIRTGLKFKIPVGFEMQIRSKSGLSSKKGLMVLNSPGTVDRGYTGEVMVIIFNTNKEEYKINVGDKIAQAVLCPVLDGEVVVIKETEKITDGDRGDKGFGSTGL